MKISLSARGQADFCFDLGIWVVSFEHFLYTLYSILVPCYNKVTL